MWLLKPPGTVRMPQLQKPLNTYWTLDIIDSQATGCFCVLRFFSCLSRERMSWHHHPEIRKSLFPMWSWEKTECCYVIMILGNVEMSKLELR